MIQIDRTARQAIYLQLVRQMIALIEKGTLPPGHKLPGTRQLSILLHLHRNTVVNAYEELRAQGWIEIKANRDAGALDVIGLWLEPKIRMSKPRRARIDAELERWRRYLGLDRVVWRESVSVF